MKQLASLFLLVTGVALGTFCRAQPAYSSCAAAFVGDKMVVDTYTPTGLCKLPETATGTLTVQTVDLSPTGSKAIDKIEFKVAIRDKATGTLHMYSGDMFRQLPVQRVLANCKKGDHIVLLTIDQRYSLPHNEVLVQ